MLKHFVLSAVAATTAIIAASLATPAMADLQTGIAAYQNKDFTAALADFRPLAEQGDAEAQNYLCDMYYYGQGATKDLAQSAQWCGRAAAQGQAAAQQSLGYAYEHGEGVTQSDVEAARWYRASADQGYKWGQNSLGLFYRAGRGGLSRDDAEAMRLFRAAADQGLATAQANLADMYYAGTGVAKDLAEAARWYRLAADQGNAWSQYCLGYLYEHGESVAADLAEAKRWYEAAAQQGNADAKSALERLASNGTPAASNIAGAPSSGPSNQGGCQRIVGDWQWFVGNIVTVAPNNVLSYRANATAPSVPFGSWSCAGGTYTLAWANGFVDTLQLSPDGASLVGHNQNGAQVSAQRIQ